MNILIFCFSFQLPLEAGAVTESWNLGPFLTKEVLYPLSYYRSVRAENGSNPRPQLGRLMLYQLSYFRNVKPEWVVMDSNHRRRKPADLQSAPFGHSVTTLVLSTHAGVSMLLSLLSDSDQRPRDYKSRALAN